MALIKYPEALKNQIKDFFILYIDKNIKNEIMYVFNAINI